MSTSWSVFTFSDQTLSLIVIYTTRGEVVELWLDKTSSGGVSFRVVKYTDPEEVNDPVSRIIYLVFQNNDPVFLFINLVFRNKRVSVFKRKHFSRLLLYHSTLQTNNDCIGVYKVQSDTACISLSLAELSFQFFRNKSTAAKTWVHLLLVISLSHSKKRAGKFT